MNILVGPNNCGKSTILDALRILQVGLRHANARNPEYIEGPDGHRLGYQLSENVLPIAVENVHTDYVEQDTTILYRLSNGNRLQIYFPPQGGCKLFALTEGKTPKRTTSFRKAFPISVGVVPVLGPVEHQEDIRTEKTVKSSLATHRASRHFRNYWYHFPDGFDRFAELVSRTWPSMEIFPPEKPDQLARTLVMFAEENRIARELYWAGFGFQVWCQMLTHVSRANRAGDTIVIIDEPEIYLHPDVQRKLLGLLRRVTPDVMIGTHSTEIMGEADPTEILLVEKAAQSAKRLQDAEGVQEALNSVGSVQNITLTRLARNRRILFVEGGDDFRILRRFARQIGLEELADGAGITSLESGGFDQWERVKGLAWGFESALGGPIHIAAVFDRDYWSDEEIEEIRKQLAEYLEVAHIHQRKELENYLLVPKVLERALERAIAERVRRTGEEIERTQSMDAILDEVTRVMKKSVEGQYVSRRREFLESDPRDDATITTETLERLDSMWEEIPSRMELVPGKEVLRKLRTVVQERYSVTLSDIRIIDQFRADEVPEDLMAFLHELDGFRA